MSLQLGGLLGAAANLGSSFSKPKSLRAFLKNIDKFGVQVQNNFEVNFSGLQDITFFVTDLTLPGQHQNFTTVYYDGKEVYIPVSYEYDHDFSMTILNDANGYIYSAVTNFMVSDMSTSLVGNGYTMLVKALTGDKNYKGTTYTLNGVRFSSVSGLTYGYSQNSVSTFSVSFKCVECIATPGGLSKAANIIGAANSILG